LTLEKGDLAAKDVLDGALTMREKNAGKDRVWRWISASARLCLLLIWGMLGGAVVVAFGVCCVARNLSVWLTVIACCRSILPPMNGRMELKSLVSRIEENFAIMGVARFCLLDCAKAISCMVWDRLAVLAGYHGPCQSSVPKGLLAAVA